MVTIMDALSLDRRAKDEVRPDFSWTLGLLSTRRLMQDLSPAARPEHVFAKAVGFQAQRRFCGADPEMVRKACGTDSRMGRFEGMHAHEELSEVTLSLSL